MCASLLFLPFAAVSTTAFWLTWWFNGLVYAVVLGGGVIFHRRKMNVIKHENADLERKLLERTELLEYSRNKEQKVKEDTERVTKHKNQLLSKISHNIRTPMNTLMGMASLLNDTDLNVEQQEYAHTILHSGESLLTIINDILLKEVLEYSKVDANKELEHKDFDLANTLEEVLELFAGNVAANGVDLVYALAKDVPAQVVGDAMKLKQVLMNLVENAVRFTAKGEVFIGVSGIENSDNNSITLQFDVKDTGKGLDEFRAELLNKDLQDINASLNTNGASGVGLIMCKKLVNLMGGKIFMDSTEGEETVFSFSIVVNKSLQSVRTSTEAKMVGFEGKRVLVIDDNRTVLKVLASKLKSWNLVPETVDNEKAALETLGLDRSFDLVLLDYRLGDKNCVELAEAVKELNNEVPILLLNNPIVEEYKKNPELFFSVIDKPIKDHVLSEQILAILRQKNKGTGIDQSKKLSAEFAQLFPLSILVAEDNAMNQKLVIKVLNKLGYEPYITGNGKEVLEEVSQKYYDLILMDVEMPEMDGLEATRMIRLCLNEQPLIIAMTANTLQGDREACLRAGMDDYLAKPVRLEQLVNILEKWATNTVV